MTANHGINFQFADAARTFGCPLAVALLISLGFRLGAWLGFLPSPRPMLDADRTVIVHQADASRKPSKAKVLLIGDSSCMMNVDAARLSELLGVDVLNLGSVRVLGLKAYCKLLTNHLEFNEPKKIVLLVNPNFVRKNSPSKVHVDAFDHYLAGRDYNYGGADNLWDLRRILGVYIVEGRLIGRLPLPLPERFGDFYGFTTELYHYMEEHRGSAVDPRILNENGLRGSSDYWVDPLYLEECALFSASIPSSTQLFVGLTPVPESFSNEEFRAVQYKSLLRDWAAAFPAAVPINGLPPTLPDGYFATKTHLRPQAVGIFTERLHQELLSASATE